MDRAPAPYMTEELAARLEAGRVAYRVHRARASGGRIAQFGSVCATDWARPVVYGLDATHADRVDEILAWYAETGTTPLIETLPRNEDRPLYAVLSARGLVPLWFHSYLWMPLADRDRDPDDGIKDVTGGDVTAWIEAYIDAHAWDYAGEERARWVANLSKQYTDDRFRRYVVDDGGEAVAIGCAWLSDVGTVHLTNAATRPSHRGRGLHAALIRRRLDDAAAEGAEFATSDTRAMSVSQRNLERAGFRIAFHKATWSWPGA